jgi:hypothetical protein
MQGPWVAISPSLECFTASAGLGKIQDALRQKVQGGLGGGEANFHYVRPRAAEMVTGKFTAIAYHSNITLR